MSDGGQASASLSDLPAEWFAERPGQPCSRCEGMELVDCDVCQEGKDGCLRCEGSGLIVCPACDVPTNAELPVVSLAVEPVPCRSTAKLGASKQRAKASSASLQAEPPNRRKSSVPLPGPQPERPGSEGCGERLKWARRLRRISVVQLARRAGCSPNTLRSYESGQRLSGPSLKTIEDLAQALGVRRSWLAFGLGSVDKAQRTSGASADNEMRAS